MDMPRRVWDNYQVIDYVKLSVGKRVRVACAIKEGVRYLTLSEQYYRYDLLKWIPTKRNLSFPLVTMIKEGTETLHPLNDLIKLLVPAVEALSTMSLYDQENAVYQNTFKLDIGEDI